MFVGCSEIIISVIVKMLNLLELSKFFVCLGGRIKFLTACGDRKNCWVVVC